MDQDRWRRLSDLPLTISAVVFLIAYSVEVIANLQGHAADVTEVVILLTWAFFSVDYVVNLVLAENRRRWFVRHLLDLAIVVLPLLRPLRLLRLVTLLAILQRTAGRSFRGRVVTYVVGSAVLLVYVCALAVLDVERPAPHATITTFPEALWWAFVTIATVGYGDYVPVTGEGRIIAVALMLGGIALLGIVTATLASWIVERVSEKEESSQGATRGDLRELSRQIAELRMLVEAQARTEPPGSHHSAGSSEPSADAPPTPERLTESHL